MQAARNGLRDQETKQRLFLVAAAVPPCNADGALEEQRRVAAVNDYRPFKSNAVRPPNETDRNGTGGPTFRRVRILMPVKAAASLFRPLNQTVFQRR